MVLKLQFLIGHFSQSQPLCLRSVVTSSRGQSFLLHFRKDIFCVCVEMKMKKGAMSADGEFEIAIISKCSIKSFIFFLQNNVL